MYYEGSNYIQPLQQRIVLAAIWMQTTKKRKIMIIKKSRYRDLCLEAAVLRQP
jgi:hypothetical protein